MKPQHEAPVPSPQESFTVKVKPQVMYDSVLHKHDMFELTFIPKVRALRYIGDSINEIHKDELVLLGPNLMHCWHIVDSKLGEIPALVVYFDKDFLGDEFFDVPEFSRFRQILNLAERGIRFNDQQQPVIYSQMQQLLQKKGMPRLIQLLEIFNTISSFNHQDFQLMASANYQAVHKENGQQMISSVIHYIQQNYGKKIKLREVADLAHLSTSAFCRYFKRCTGKTFLDYVKEVRVSHACQLLQSHKKMMSEVGYLCGYNNMANFNRQFRQITGKSPKEYQKLYQLDTVENA